MVSMLFVDSVSPAMSAVEGSDPRQMVNDGKAYWPLVRNVACKRRWKIQV